jgi:hypothetical protein
VKRIHFAVAGALGVIGFAQFQVNLLDPAFAADPLAATVEAARGTPRPAMRPPVRPALRPALRLAGTKPDKATTSATAAIARRAGALSKAADPALAQLPAEAAMALLPGPAMETPMGGFADAARVLDAVASEGRFADTVGTRRSALVPQLASQPEAWSALPVLPADDDLRLVALGPTNGFGPRIPAADVFDREDAISAASNVLLGTGAIVPSNVQTAVPDIETWTTLLAGLLLVGISQRRRPRQSSVAS